MLVEPADADKAEAEAHEARDPEQAFEVRHVAEEDLEHHERQNGKPRKPHRLAASLMPATKSASAKASQTAE